MRRSALVLALNVGVLVATSPATYQAEDATEFVEVHLTSEDQPLSIQGRVEAGEEVISLAVYLTFEGSNLSTAAGTLLVQDLGQERPVGMPLEGSEEVSFELPVSGARTSAHFFDLTLAIEGEAELEGELSLRVVAESVEKNVSVEIVEWSVE